MYLKRFTVPSPKPTTKPVTAFTSDGKEEMQCGKGGLNMLELSSVDVKSKWQTSLEVLESHALSVWSYPILATATETQYGADSRTQNRYSVIVNIQAHFLLFVYILTITVMKNDELAAYVRVRPFDGSPEPKIHIYVRRLD